MQRVSTRIAYPRTSDQMKILGVSFSNTMTFNAHIDSLVCQSSQSMIALCVLRSHGLIANPLWEVTRATLVTRLLYASPAWWGFLDAEGKRRLQATIHKLQQSELLPRDFPTFGELCQLKWLIRPCFKLSSTMKTTFCTISCPQKKTVTTTSDLDRTTAPYHLPTPSSAENLSLVCSTIIFFSPHIACNLFLNFRYFSVILPTFSYLFFYFILNSPNSMLVNAFVILVH